MSHPPKQDASQVPVQEIEQPVRQVWSHACAQAALQTLLQPEQEADADVAEQLLSHEEAHSEHTDDFTDPSQPVVHDPKQLSLHPPLQLVLQFVPQPLAALPTQELLQLLPQALCALPTQLLRQSSIGSFSHEDSMVGPNATVASIGSKVFAAFLKKERLFMFLFVIFIVYIVYRFL